GTDHVPEAKHLNDCSPFLFHRQMWYLGAAVRAQRLCATRRRRNKRLSSAVWFTICPQGVRWDLGCLERFFLKDCDSPVTFGNKGMMPFFFSTILVCRCIDCNS
ncbi:unnamed protein product, partial [Ixodes persulcatus]